MKTYTKKDSIFKNHNIFYYIAKPFKQIYKTIKSSLLCIKYPFLYPRNIFTGNHYNNRKIVQFHQKWYRHTLDAFFITFNKEKPEYLQYSGTFDNRNYFIRYRDQDNLEIVDSTSRKIVYSKPISYFGTGYIKEVGWYENKPYIIVDDDWIDNENVNRLVQITHAPKFQKFILFLDWINDHPLQILHCLTSYTLLDCMPIGWRKAFGMEMCKDIKQALLDNYGRKALKAYRVIDIKEKFGGLRWYDNAAPEAVRAIIDYYEEKSYKICINCGKTAKYVSKGWISPYCEDCAINKDRYIPLSKPDAWNEALGYY